MIGTAAHHTSTATKGTSDDGACTQIAAFPAILVLRFYLQMRVGGTLHVRRIHRGDDPLSSTLHHLTVLEQGNAS
jgi:hypothetical protein